MDKCYDSALAKGSSACRGLAKIDFYVLAASSSKCLRKSLRDKESRIEKKRDIPRKKLSSSQSSACPLDSERIKCNHDLLQELWTETLGICFEPLPLYQVHGVWSDNFVWWFMCQVMVIFEHDIISLSTQVLCQVLTCSNVMTLMYV